MAKSAELRADDFVFAGLCRRKVDRKVQAGDKVLLYAQLADVEGMSDILGVHEQLNFPVDRHIKLRRDDVVARLDVVRRVETEEIRIAFVNFVRVQRSKLSIDTRVAEIESELAGLRLNLHGVGLRRSEIDIGP